MQFFTRKVVEPVTKSHVNFVVLDGKGGNTWERDLARLLDDDPRIGAFVKNDHVAFGRWATPKSAT